VAFFRDLATDDGTLLVSSATGLFRSMDQGRTLELLGNDAPPEVLGMTRFPGGYTMVGAMADPRIWWSTDSVTWTLVRPQL